MKNNLCVNKYTQCESKTDNLLKINKLQKEKVAIFSLDSNLQQSQPAVLEN